MSTALSAALGLLALVVAVAALVLATIANRRWARRPRSRDAAGPSVDAEPRADGAMLALQAQVDELAAAVAQLSAGLAALEPDVSALRGDVEDARRQHPTALRHVAVVRYDAFADVGGRLSYSLAVLDDTRSGLVLTTLAGKSDVRTYVRTVSGGTGDGTLTAEEQQAIEAAAAGSPGSPS